MTSSEYKNTIEWTLKHSDESSDHDKVQRILRNLGTPFPQNDGSSTETIISLLSSGDYMGWNPCSKDQARFCVNNGYPAVAIYNNTVVILLPDDESVKISSTVPKSTSKLVRKVTELNDIKADQIHFFAYATLLENHDTADRNSNGNDDMIAAYATKTTCTSSCQSSCQSTCQTSCQSCNTCQTTCESKCQSACQSSCQSCNTCQTTCQTSCQTACESKCQTSCESSCQSACQSSCQTCNTCQSTCQTSCQSCNVCDNCQSGCQISCQTTCESKCQTSCETSCQSTCQVSCQTCNTCQTTCETTCQSTCQISCQTCNTCQTTCEATCQTTCQISCQTCDTCQTCNLCQNTCEAICQSGQNTCQTCNSCQSTCDSICQNACESTSQTCAVCQTLCDQGDTCNTCDSCDNSESCNHIWGGWITVTPANCTSTGKKRRTCKTCSASEEQNIAVDKNVHSWPNNITYAKEHPHNGSKKCLWCGKEHPDAPFIYDGKYPGCAACNPLDAPTGLKAEVIANNSVKVTWNSVSNALYYQLFNNDNLVYEGEKTSYTLNYVSIGEILSFKVRALTNSYVSPYSENTIITAVIVTPMLIYRTRNREVYGFDNDESIVPVIAED